MPVQQLLLAVAILLLLLALLIEHLVPVFTHLPPTYSYCILFSFTDTNSPSSPPSEPTMLESLSRTVRGYVPSSLPLPPRISSRPVSVGSFLSPYPGSNYPPQEDDDESPPVSPDNIRATAYPGLDSGDPILWSRFDDLPLAHSSKTRTLLFLGYDLGLQIWDCTSLGSVTEVLNLKGRGGKDGVGRVRYAGVLSDGIEGEGARIGIV